MALALVTLAVFWSVARNDFVNYDDPDYVTENSRVQGGLTWPNVKWALQSGHASNWHPVTWLSHMLDCEIFGLWAGGHHLVNLLIHVLNTLLVFFLWRRMTGALWRSALVAALFGLHPLRVESVAWVAERKDVLSACFGLLCLMAYVRYARSRQAPETVAQKNDALRITHHAGFNYGLALIFCALGLMSKPMLVTLPFVLLLLDYWPLARVPPSPGRSQCGFWWRLLREKIPFLVLSTASSIITFRVQSQGGAVQEYFPLGIRVENALVACVRYLGGTFWPQDLAVLYPHPGTWPVRVVLAAAVLLLVVSAGVIVGARTRPFLAVGWFWFLGMLVPVLGLVQVGVQAMADRYTYLPSIGLMVMLVWGVGEMFPRWPQRTRAFVAASVLSLAVLGLITTRQLQHWRNTETLFGHTLAVTQQNYIAHSVLGLYLSDQGRTAAAVEQYELALKINPEYADAHNNLGLELALRGRLEEAIAFFQKAIALNPRLPSAHSNLGLALAGQHQLAAALDAYETSLRLQPDDPRVRSNYANALADLGRVAEAIHQYRAALRLAPNNSDIHRNLGIILADQGQPAEAAVHFTEALRLTPNDALAKRGLQRLRHKDK